MFMKSSQDISNKILVGKDLNGRKIFFFSFYEGNKFSKKANLWPVSYTHLTLPTKLEV